MGAAFCLFQPHAVTLHHSSGPASTPFCPPQAVVDLEQQLSEKQAEVEAAAAAEAAADEAWKAKK